jgi:hypothetical protein
VAETISRSLSLKDSSIDESSLVVKSPQDGAKPAHNHWKQRGTKE